MAETLDRKGLPFVGPAGRLLDRALEAAGVDRRHLYVTNAVKHFKWQSAGGRAGKRRLHKTPAQREIDACHQWLEREVATVQPEVIACLGATAARAVISKDFKVTLHPSVLLRLRGEEEKKEAFRHFVKDLSLIRKALG